MKTMNLAKITAFLTLVLFTANAGAALTLAFTTPDGTVGPSDSIDVWLTLSSDSGFTFDSEDPDGDGSFGDVLDDDPYSAGFFAFIEDANEGQGGDVFFEDILFTNLNVSYTCTGDFTAGGANGCSPGDNYTFTFATDFSSSEPNFVFLESLSQAPGTSEEYLFGTFDPVAGGAAPGTYNFFTATLFVEFELLGFDDFGNEHSITDRVNLAQTCLNGDSSCDFTRVVVPVPAAAWMFGSALLGMIGVRRRRS